MLIGCAYSCGYFAKDQHTIAQSRICLLSRSIGVSCGVCWLEWVKSSRKRLLELSYVVCAEFSIGAGVRPLIIKYAFFATVWVLGRQGSFSCG